jgi:imidazole glycerol-phosphate synthase subunit HisH
VQCVIIDNGMGNLRSIQHKLLAAGLTAGISSDPGGVAEADVLILPGVGHFAQGMENLRRSGLRPVLQEQEPIAKESRWKNGQRI